jgi:hypothetical protein
MEIQLPVDGLFEAGTYEQQPDTTSPNLMNVRAVDTEKNRKRLCKRPGFIQAYSTQIAGDHPVIAITQIATTYITPES